MLHTQGLGMLWANYDIFFFSTNMQKAENEYYIYIYIVSTIEFPNSSFYIYLEILNNQKTKQVIQSKHKIKNYNQIKF